MIRRFIVRRRPRTITIGRTKGIQTMGKIIKKEDAGQLAVAGSEQFFAAPTVQNSEQSDRMIPVLHLFQSTSQEQEKLGKFNLGDLIDAVECRRVASRRIAVVTGKKSYVRWQDSTPLYVYDRRSEVPPEDLEWTTDAKGSRIPPLCQEVMSFFVLVEGEPFPYLLRFKRTGYNAGRTLNELAERARAQKRIGLYELGFTKETGTKGVYAVPTVRQVGNAPDELAARVVAAYGSLTSKAVQVDEGAMKSGDDDLPI